MRNALREFLRTDWSSWHYLGFGFAVGLILIGWRIALGLVGILAALYALGWLGRRALLRLTGGRDA